MAFCDAVRVNDWCCLASKRISTIREKPPETLTGWIFYNFKPTGLCWPVC